MRPMLLIPLLLLPFPAQAQIAGVTGVGAAIGIAALGAYTVVSTPRGAQEAEVDEAQEAEADDGDSGDSD